MMHIIILYKLKEGIARADFHDWVRRVDYPAMRALTSVDRFKTFAAQKLLMGEGAPSVEYIEVFELSDFEGFVTEDLPGETVQNIMGQFTGFVDTPEFIVCEEIG
jgi:hypothetical protein